MYGSHTAHVSTLPEANVASASAAWRYLTLTSLRLSAARFREVISWWCADVEAERECHAERDDRDLRSLVDAEPDDEQRNETREGHDAQHLDGGVHEGLADPEPILSRS